MNVLPLALVNAMWPDGEQQLFYSMNPQDYKPGDEGETAYFAYKVTRVERNSGSWMVYGFKYPRQSNDRTSSLVDER